jgi:hypothetical protein
VSLLPIAANSWSGQVLSRSSSRVRSPGNSTDAVALRSQTALTGSDQPRTIRQREQGRPRVHSGTYCVLSGPCFVIRASRPALARPERRASESDGLGAEAAARAAPWGRLETVQKLLTRGLAGGLAQAGVRQADRQVRQARARDQRVLADRPDRLGLISARVIAGRRRAIHPFPRRRCARTRISSPCVQMGRHTEKYCAGKGQ